MSPVSQYRNRTLRRSSPNPAVPGCMLVFLIAALIALPSTAEAWHWSLASGWDFDSYAECMDYYANNPPSETYVTYGSPGAGHFVHYTPEQLCAEIKYEEYEKLRKQEEITRVIVLSCRAQSVTDAQFEACVALATGR